MEDLPTDKHPCIFKEPDDVGPSLFSTTSELPPEDSELSVDESGPSTPTHSLESFDDEVRIIKPYAIEEPDNDECDTTRRDLPPFPDRFEQWQRDLSDYMHNLNYQPDGQHATSPKIRKKGQKRKVAHTPKQHSGNIQPLQKTQPSHEQHCAKKRRSKPSGGTSVTNPFRAFREAKTDESSCSEAPSSGIETTNNSPLADEMDID